jgi:hypothetical protein
VIFTVHISRSLATSACLKHILAFSVRLLSLLLSCCLTFQSSLCWLRPPLPPHFRLAARARSQDARMTGIYGSFGFLLCVSIFSFSIVQAPCNISDPRPGTSTCTNLVVTMSRQRVLAAMTIRSSGAQAADSVGTM